MAVLGYWDIRGVSRGGCTPPGGPLLGGQRPDPPTTPAPLHGSPARLVGGPWGFPGSGRGGSPSTWWGGHGGLRASWGGMWGSPCMWRGSWGSPALVGGAVGVQMYRGGMVVPLLLGGGLWGSPCTCLWGIAFWGHSGLWGPPCLRGGVAGERGCVLGGSHWPLSPPARPRHPPAPGVHRDALRGQALQLRGRWGARGIPVSSLSSLAFGGGHGVTQHSPPPPCPSSSRLRQEPMDQREGEAGAGLPQRRWSPGGGGLGVPRVPMPARPHAPVSPCLDVPSSSRISSMGTPS